MKRLFVFLVFIIFAVVSLAQTISDTVILAWKRKDLTQQQEELFDTLQLQIFSLNDVRYFKKDTPSYAGWNNYYHIRCSESYDTILNQLQRSSLFDTIYFDKIVETECTNPVITDDPLNNTYVNNMLGLPCAWSITTGNSGHTSSDL